MTDLDWMANNVGSWSVPEMPYATVIDFGNDNKQVIYHTYKGIGSVYIEDWQRERDAVVKRLTEFVNTTEQKL